MIIHECFTLLTITVQNILGEAPIENILFNNQAKNNVDAAVKECSANHVY